MATNYPTLVSTKYDPSAPALPVCSQPIKEGTKVNTLIVTFDNGMEQRRMKSPPKRTFDLTYNVLKKNEYLTLRDFFLTVLNTESFNWTHPIEKTQFLVRFDMDTFSGENFAHGPQGPLYRLSVKLLQVPA